MEQQEAHKILSELAMLQAQYKKMGLSKPRRTAMDRLDEKGVDYKSATAFFARGKHNYKTPRKSTNHQGANTSARDVIMKFVDSNRPVPPDVTLSVFSGKTYSAFWRERSKMMKEGFAFIKVDDGWDVIKPAAKADLEQKPTLPIPPVVVSNDNPETVTLLTEIRDSSIRCEDLLRHILDAWKC